MYCIGTTYSLYLWGEARGRVEPAKKSHRFESAVLVNFCPALKDTSRLRHALSMSSPPPLIVYSPSDRLLHFHAFSLTSVAKSNNFLVTSVFLSFSRTLLPLHAYFVFSAMHIHPPYTCTLPPPHSFDEHFTRACILARHRKSAYIRDVTRDTALPFLL